MTRQSLFAKLTKTRFIDRYTLHVYQPQSDEPQVNPISYEDQQIVKQTIKDRSPHNLRIA
jgi:hypothetical protein